MPICEKKISGAKYKKIRNMVGKIKKFDQSMSDIYDTKARDVIKECLGEIVQDNPETYAEDMVLCANLPYTHIELQVYGKWVDDTFPYQCPYVYERKLKFRATTLFVCFNAHYDRFIMFARTAIHPKPYRLEKYAREIVHYVPWNKSITQPTSKLNINMMRMFGNTGLDLDDEIDTEDSKPDASNAESTLSG
jgi:hypothetical protein